MSVILTFHSALKHNTYCLYTCKLFPKHNLTLLFLFVVFNLSFDSQTLTVLVWELNICCFRKIRGDMFGTCKKRVLHGILILKIREQTNGYCCTQYLLVQLKKKNLFKLERKHKTANVNIHLIAV